MRALRCQLPRSNPFYADTPAPPAQLAPNALPQAEQQLSLARDPWQVLAQERATAGGGGAAAAAAAGGPAVFSEQELVVEPEPEEGEGSGEADDEVQR